MFFKSKKQRFKKQNYSKCLKCAIDTGVPFSDDQFECDDKSIGLSQTFKADLNVGKIIWKRPKDLSEIPHFLYREKLGPATQVEFIGKGPNQWFIAACCAIANDRNTLYKVIPKNQIHFLNGILKFNFWRFGTRFTVVIDDKLPTFDNKLIFSASLCGPVFWVPLLEKAYAKLYGSYEAMSKLGNLSDALADLTGAVVETIPLNDDSDERERFRMISEELERNSLICATSNDAEYAQNAFNIQKNRIYLVSNVKKPSNGTFRKVFSKDSEQSAQIRVTNTICNENKSSNQRNLYTEKLQDVWLPIEEFFKHFQTLTVCRTNISGRLSVLSGKTNTQFCFDVSQETDEIIVDVMQKTNDQPSSLRFKIYKVEMNRLYRIHNTASINKTYSTDSTKVRNICKRIKLPFGRYVLIPICSNVETDLLLRLYSHKSANLKVLKQDMPRKNFFAFLSPKYPKYVTQVIVKGANGLEKQDRFGSANPYCIIRCGRTAIKSSILHDTLNPEWDNFSAIFYHENFVSIMIELWHHSILIDSFIGQAEVIPNVTNDDLTSIKHQELCGRKKGHKRPGTVKFLIKTSEDLRSF